MFKNWSRIILLVFLLVGGTMSFGFWSVREFNNAFKALENVGTSYVGFQRVHEKNVVTVDNFASSTSTLGIDTTSTSTIVTATSSTIVVTATSTPGEPEISSTLSEQDNIDPKFELIFSPKKDGVYVGCTYEISWSASTTIDSMEAAVISADTQKAIEPITSGLAKINIIEADSQSLKWKVGTVWPGKYFISISNVNGIAIDEKSRSFLINASSSVSKGKVQSKLCK